MDRWRNALTTTDVIAPAAYTVSTSRTTVIVSVRLVPWVPLVKLASTTGVSW